MPAEKQKHKSHGGDFYINLSTEKALRNDERVVIKKRGKKTKRQNLGLCDELRWGIVMMVTHLTPSVLLPGTGSEITLLNPSAWKVATPKGRSRRAESSLQWAGEGGFSMGHWNMAGADAYRLSRIFCSWSTS